jgi:dipeptidyl aminopeptidase/acylaminoacyl peptidase
MRKTILVVLIFTCITGFAQNIMTPELLWKLGRVSALGLSTDKQFVLFDVGIPDMNANKINHTKYKIPVNGGEATVITNTDNLLANSKISPDGKYIISSEDVKVMNVYGSDFYPELTQTTAQIYTSLMYRHWDTYEDGKFGHVFIANNDASQSNKKDIMSGEPYDCPQRPFGGDEDFIWNPDSKHVLYVTKKKSGTAYTTSTNTDLYEYDITNGTTKDLTEDNKGYDINPSYSSNGNLAWLQQKRDGYEADKQDIVVSNGVTKMNLTKQNDQINVESFVWSDDGKNIFFIAPINGILQLFEVNCPDLKKLNGNLLPEVKIKQITNGDFDIAEINAQIGNTLIVTKQDINHASELYDLDLGSAKLTQLTHMNDAAYSAIATCKTERRFVTTTDNKKMLVWIIFPPNFDPAKKYPTLLYCQGGPQSALTQFYSFRWNFQLIASEGYVIVAPDRRGMPGFGTQWNEQVSKDWGGQVIKDYLSAIDNVSKEKYVDTARRGCIGASFGGYSVYELAGMHAHRFKTFIAHDGVFDFRSEYGTTDEMWFENFEKGGAYWEKNNAVAQRSFSQSPSNFVANWDAPILIIQGGKDYRVPIEQGQQAFQSAQLRGIKSEFLLLPNENHWVLQPQDAMVWQRTFFNWLSETLK